MVKYTYMYNLDGIDKINVNAYESTKQSAEQISYSTRPEESDNGTIILINNPRKFENRISDIPDSIHIDRHNFPLRNSYIGYYYDETLNMYVIDEDAVALIEHQAYVEVANKLISLHQLDRTEITNQNENGQYQDVENVICEHEGGVITLTHNELVQWKLRILEKEMR